EPGKRFFVLAFGLQGGAEVIDGLGVFRRGIAVGKTLQRLAQVLFRVGVTGFGERGNAENGIDARVAGVAAQGLLPVEERIDVGVVELLGAETDEVEFFGGLDFRRRRRWSYDRRGWLGGKTDGGVR